MGTSTTKKQISAAYRYSYSRLALNYYGFYENMCEETGIPDILKEYNEQFHQLLKGFLEGQSSSEQLEALRNQNIKTMEVLTAYTDYFQIYEYVLNRMERRFEDGVPITDSVEEFTGRVMKFLSLSKDSMVMNERIRQVLEQLPIRYTRQKFYSMVMEGLSLYIGSDKKSLENMLYILRTGSMVLVPENMEQGYEELYEILGQMKTADYLHLEKEAYQTLMDKLGYASDKLMTIAGICMELQDLMNDLYILMLAEEHAMIDLAEKQTVEKIIGAVLDDFLAGNTSMVEDEITDLLYDLEGEQENAMERYLSYPSPEEASAEPLTIILRKIDTLLSSSAFAGLEEETAPGEPVDRAYLEEQAAGFLKELEQVLQTLQKPVVRAVMARILSNLPMFFRDVSELEAYILGSLESCSDAAERECCMELIEQEMVDWDALL